VTACATQNRTTQAHQSTPHRRNITCCFKRSRATHSLPLSVARTIVDRGQRHEPMASEDMKTQELLIMQVMST